MTPRPDVERPDLGYRSNPLAPTVLRLGQYALALEAQLQRGEEALRDLAEWERPGPADSQRDVAQEMRVFARAALASLSSKERE